MGQVLTAGGGQNPARQAAINADIPVSKPAHMVNQVCGSGLRALRPDPQTWLTICAGFETGISALIAACLAGFCPPPAVSTCPITTSSTSS